MMVISSCYYQYCLLIIFNIDHSAPDEIADAEAIFENCGGELNLRDCTTGLKHTFKIRGQNGRIYNIKKSTVLWMMSDKKYECTNDRIRRFYEPRTLE